MAPSDGPGTDTSNSPYIPMFENFRRELDEHYDRRERITKVSRDVTATSKKIIFALQRVRTIGAQLPAQTVKTVTPFHSTVKDLLNGITADLQSTNFERYHRQVSPGIQEYMEALIFQHYLTTQRLLTYAEAAAHMKALSDPGSPHLLLTPMDYVLGVFDVTGEMMRLAIGSMATDGALPASPASGRTTLHDLQVLRQALCAFEAKSGLEFFAAKEVRSKLAVTMQSVEKVERALYGLVVRGSERPKGWLPDLSEREGEAEVY